MLRFDVLKCGIFLASLLLPHQAKSQDSFDYSRFLPLEKGNEWEYAGGREGASVEYYTQLVVVGDTVINGFRFWKVAQTTFDTDGVRERRTTCAIRVGNAPDYEITYVEVDGGCRVLQCFPHMLSGSLGAFNRGAPASFRVGWESYRADKVATLGDGFCHRGVCDESWVSVASDVGAYTCSGGQISSEPGIPTVRRTTDLIFARVGERTYGTEWLREDVEYAEKEPFLDVATYPNPFSHSLTLEFRGGGRPVGDLRVVLYDLLGREIVDVPVRREVNRRLVLDDEVRALPAGTYLLRVRTDGGRGLTRKMSKWK